MIITAHQPIYLPWLGFFHKIAISDIYVSLRGVQYSTNDWLNRNKILSAQGPIWLTVPVLTSGHMSKKIEEIEINNKVSWREKHWKSILMNYKKAQFFSMYADFFENMYLRMEWKYLVDINEYLLIWLLNALDIRAKVIKQKEYDFSGHKTEFIADICTKLGANLFVFGALGKEYADLNYFNSVGLRAYFQEYVHPQYKQRYPGFHSHLSVIDLLFNCGPSSRDILMSGNVSKIQIQSGSVS